MKRFFALLTTLCILLTLGSLSLPVSAAAGEVSFAAGATAVTVGESVTLTVTYKASSVGAGTAEIRYDANVFDFVSLNGTGTANSGAAGLLKYTFIDTANKPTYTFTATFKAKAAGSGSFDLASYDLATFDEDPFTVPEKSVTVAAINPTQSGNANLATLKPSSGTLTPKFSPNTTEYTVKVPYTTTSLTISATPVDKGASVTSVSGSNSLQVGKNTRVVTVTAANGTTKQYTVVITRSENQNTTTGGSGGTSTTEPTPPEDALEVTVDDTTYLVSDTQPSAALPTGFVWSTASVNGVLVSAAKHEKADLTLLYLTKPEDSKAGNFFLYNGTTGQFATYNPLTAGGGQYILLDMPAGQATPVGTLRSTFLYEEGRQIPAFVYEDPSLADFTIVYAVSPAGSIGLYVHDKLEGSLQRYREVDIPAATPPVDMDEPFDLLDYLAAHKNGLLVVAALCGGLALLTGAVILVTVVIRQNRGGRKH